MTQTLSKENKKCVKVICTFFGQRRLTHNTPQNILDFVKINLENEINIDNGVDTDVIIVNNDVGNEPCNELVNTFNNRTTLNGKIIVEHRKNLGGSFGAYYEMFLKYKDLYDYWFFCEDDVLIYKEKYLKHFIEELDSDETIGFICLAPLSTNPLYPIHSGGGCGLTSKDKFVKSRTIEYMVDFLNSLPEKTYYNDLENYEINFTNQFVKSDMKIKNHSLFSPYCVNYNKHHGQMKNYNHNIDNLEKIYKVGF